MMAVEVSCSCGMRYQVGPELLGQVVRCKSCGQQFVAAATPVAPPDPLGGAPAGGWDPLATDDLSALEHGAMADHSALAAQQTRQQASGGQRTNQAKIWQDRGCLVVTKDSSLPPRCVRTNRPQDERYIEFMNYIPIWAKIISAILIVCTGCFCSWIIFLILLSSGELMPVGFKMRVEYGVTKSYMLLRYLYIGIGVITFLFGMMIFIGALITAGESVIGLLMFLISPAFLLSGGYLASAFGRPVRCVYVDDLEEYMWLKGVCPAYLAKLPQFKSDEPRLNPQILI